MQNEIEKSHFRSYSYFSKHFFPFFLQGYCIEAKFFWVKYILGYLDNIINNMITIQIKGFQIALILSFYIIWYWTWDTSR